MCNVGNGHLEAVDGWEEAFWSDDEKCSICAQTSVPGVSVSQVARRYLMRTNLVHAWLKDPRSSPEPTVDEMVSDKGFLPLDLRQRGGPVSV